MHWMIDLYILVLYIKRERAGESVAVRIHYAVVVDLHADVKVFGKPDVATSVIVEVCGGVVTGSETAIPVGEYARL